LADPARSWPALYLRFSPSPHPGHVVCPGHLSYDEQLEARLFAALDDLAPIGIEDDGPLTWRVFWPTREQRDAARASLRQTFNAERLDAQPADVPDENWVERSQAELGPVVAGRFRIVPPWLVSHRPGEIVIRPSMGFGTGHHASTRLCLEALQRLDLAGRSALDVGTGSGVLAIAAHRLGANPVFAIDNDPDAIANARENLALNGVAGNIELREDTLETLTVAPADVVIANLAGALLCRAASRLAALATPGGHLVLSGILDYEEPDVVAAFQAAARVAARKVEGEWVGLILITDLPTSPARR
jgi:ribosomal protein L11 methyltransferase